MERPVPPRSRGVFTNRTLNLRAIRAIGYDMDYTLIHYNVDVWERHAYAHVKQKLIADGWPLERLEFDPELIIRGLIIDIELGNILKANRFGFVKQATHGTRPMDFEAVRDTYARTIVDLSEKRWAFLNTLFSLSEACLYAQIIDLLDEGKMPKGIGYSDVYRRVRNTVDDAHLEGALKSEVVRDPARFIEPDPEVPLALLDQKHSGKKLLLITNSDWAYTDPLMSWAFNAHLPPGMVWKDLFDVVIVSAGKPAFFTQRTPLFQVVNDEGLLRPAVRGFQGPGIYLGGNVAQVEQHLGLSGDQILYVGDHMYGDVHVTKNLLRWRTALVLRELEREVVAVEAFRASQRLLETMMAEKEQLEAEYSWLRLQLQRRKVGYGPPVSTSVGELQEKMTALRSRLVALDDKLAPLAKGAAEVSNKRWGPLLRAGNDKSHLARQLERHADIYVSRVSNLLYATPFVYLRSHRGSLPHDPVAEDEVVAQAGAGAKVKP